MCEFYPPSFVFQQDEFSRECFYAKGQIIFEIFLYIYMYIKKKTLYFTLPFLKLICEAVINGVFTHMLSGRVYDVCVVSYVHNAYFLYYCRSSLNCCILRWFDLIIKYMRSVW